MADEFHIKEKRPTGKGSIQYVVNRIEENVKRTNDMRDVWGVVEPDIEQAMKYTFSKSNPNRWDSLNDKYRAWKTKNGYTATTGIMTGALKKSVTDSALVKKKRKYMTWGVNKNIQGYRGKSVGQYAHYFDKRRPIFDYVKRFYKSIAKKVVNEIKKRGWS